MVDLLFVAALCLEQLLSVWNKDPLVLNKDGRIGNLPSTF